MNDLRRQGSPEATDELWSLAHGPGALINTYSGCISNGVRFHTNERDNRHRSQNSGLVVEGDHDNHAINFYGHLTKVWEMTYLFRHRVILFQCEWFNTGTDRTLRIDPHSTSVDIRSRWYKDDPFVLPSQVQQVFYLNDTKLGENWRVVERFERRGIWNVPEMDDFEANNAPNDEFQQEETTEFVPVVEDLITTPLLRNDIEPEIILEGSCRKRARAENVEVDEFICDADDEAELLDEHDKENEDEFDTDFDTDLDIEP